MQKIDLSISLVTYKSNKKVLTETVQSVLNSVDVEFRLFIIDNSPTDEIRSWFNDIRIEYIFNNINMGFGAAHNILMKDQVRLGRYHLVLNPDIKFNQYVLKGLVDFMDCHQDVGSIIPKVYYPNGTLCPVCRLLPTPFDLLLRMFVPFKSWRQKVSNKYLMNFCDFNHIINAPYLSGCFMFLRSDIIKEVGAFDDKMFMYAEDVDLSRRIHNRYKTLYYPELSIVHIGAEESHRSFRLLIIHMKSCVYYLNKWGWFFDRDRKVINKQTIIENM